MLKERFLAPSVRELSPVRTLVTEGETDYPHTSAFLSLSLAPLDSSLTEGAGGGNRLQFPSQQWQAFYTA